MSLLTFQKIVRPENIRTITDLYTYAGDQVLVELPPFMEWPALMPAIGIYGYVSVKELAVALFPDTEATNV